MAALIGNGSWEMSDNLDETRRAVELAENRARLDQKKTQSRVTRRNEREFAQALHREADQFYHNGDYETALVLYHRAANLFPRDSSHSVAARRTAATISSWNNPPKTLRKPSANTTARLDATVCPETAAIRAASVLTRSPNVSSVTEVLRYFDDHKSLWRKLPRSGPSAMSQKPARPKTMLRQLNNLANMSLKNLEAAFNSGRMTAALKIAGELLTLSSGLRGSRDYQIAGYRYLSLIHVSLKRHDRAVAAVARMLRLSRATGNSVLICRALVTLGKVHLPFGHLNAAAIAWENTAHCLTDPVPLAWIRHEIGRCYLETGVYGKSLAMAQRCITAATRAGSSKWILHGNLLLGQSLIKLGRFAEALHELKVSVRIAEEEADAPVLSYVQGLIDRVTRALRAAANTGTEGSAGDPGLFTTVREDSLITTVFSHRDEIMECQSESSGSTGTAELDGEITTYSRKRSPTRSPCRGGTTSDLTIGEEKTGETIPPDGLAFRPDVPAPFPRNEIVSSLSHPRPPRDSQDIAETNAAGGAEEDASDNFEDEPRRNRLKLRDTSSTSLHSNRTSLTYVVENETGDRGAERRTLEATEGKDVRTLFNKAEQPRLGSPRNPSVSSAEDFAGRDDFAEALRMIKQLDDKNEQELLEMLKHMMLSSGAMNRSGSELATPVSVFSESPEPRNATEREFRTSKSCEDRNNKISVNHALYRYSLPSSPRNCDADNVSHTCEGRAGTAQSD